MSKMMSEGFEKNVGGFPVPGSLTGGLGGLRAPPVRHDPQFNIDRLRIAVKEAQLEVERRQIDLQEAMFRAGQIGPKKTIEKDTDIKLGGAKSDGGISTSKTSADEALSEPVPGAGQESRDATPEPQAVEIPAGFERIGPDAFIAVGDGLEREILFSDGYMYRGFDYPAIRPGKKNRPIAYRILPQPSDQPQQHEESAP